MNGRYCTLCGQYTTSGLLKDGKLTCDECETSIICSLCGRYSLNGKLSSGVLECTFCLENKFTKSDNRYEFDFFNTKK